MAAPARARDRAGAPSRRQRGTHGHFRACRRCKTPRPSIAFPLLNDPHTVMRGHATRYWCEDCLTLRGHIRPPVVDPDPEPVYALPPKRRTKRLRGRVAEHQLVADLIDVLLDAPGLVPVLRKINTTAPTAPILAAVLAHPEAAETLRRVLAHPHADRVAERAVKGYRVATGPVDPHSERV